MTEVSAEWRSAGIECQGQNRERQALLVLEKSQAGRIMRKEMQMHANVQLHDGVPVQR
eukprot:IDg18308t1